MAIEICRFHESPAPLNLTNRTVRWRAVRQLQLSVSGAVGRFLYQERSSGIERTYARYPLGARAQTDGAGENSANEPQAVTVEYQEAVEPALVESPIADRAGVDMDEPGMRVPADSTALHRARCRHRLGKPRIQTDVERPADDVLAVLGNAEHRSGEHRVGFGRAICRKDRRPSLPDRIENIGQKIDDPDIHLRLFT